MSRITTNIPSLVAQRHLGVAQRSLSKALERLSSGLKINRGADDPAGLIVSERLRSEVSAVRQAIDNSARAINVIATTEGALNEVAVLLNDINALLVEAANRGAFSDDEVAANQLQIDASIDSITRIANTTSFAGKKLLNGTLDYVSSGIVASQLANVHVLGANFGTRSNIPVTVDVSVSAQQAQLAFAGPGLSTAGVTLDVGGLDGVISLSFPASATSVEIVNAINTVTDSTGITAVASGTNGSAGLRILSQSYGSDAFVSVTEMDNGGIAPLTDRDGAVDDRTNGRDAVATVNGRATTANGLELASNTAMLKMELILSISYGGGSTGLGSSSFVITEGGALFQLGPQVNPSLQENIGIQSMQANKLGNALLGYLSELQSGQSYSLDSEKFKEASDIVNEVINQVSRLRGRLGAFEKDTLHPNIEQLQITAENLVSAESVIRDTDFAVETSELTRSQILVQAGNSILAIANAQSQNVLTLLGG